MAEIYIKLIYNLESGKKDIFIDFESDADALPIEHEEGHRDIVEQLIGQKVVSAEEVGDVVIKRLEPQGKAETSNEQSAEPERESASQ